MRQTSSVKGNASAPLLSVPPELWLHALITLCIGLGCAYPLSTAMGLIVSFKLCACVCCGVTLLFMLFDCLPRLHAAAYVLLLCAIFAPTASLMPQYAAVSASLTLFLNGQSIALAAYSHEIALILCLLFTGIGATFAGNSRVFFPLAVLTLFVLLTVSLLGTQTSPIAFLPLLLALLLSSRAQGVSGPRIAACSALTLLLASLFLPLSAQTVPQLEHFAARVRQGIEDYLFFTEPRTAFSLSSTGYQPLGANRLGGPAQPTQEPVMQVTTTKRTLLRGAIRSRYTGSCWEDATSGRRYLLISPRFGTLRRDLFDQNRPTASLREELPELFAISVSMLADSASTLYVTQRFRSPTGDDIVAYFSPSSELFTTRSLSAGSSYTFFGSVLSSATQGVRRLVLAAETTEDTYYETVQKTYLELPDTLDSRVYVLASQITAQAQNDYDRAAALCGYLQRSYPYTLKQSIPPEESDFVSWFLLEEKQGYCTAFASAMAVMARCVGLPSRYIEGYAATPDADGIARVSQNNAHAWVEIYFEGFGWLTFDPTPREGENQREPVQSDSSDSDAANAQEPSDDPNPPESSPSPTPSSTPSPTPSPTSSPDPLATPTPEDMTPTPSPAQTNTPPPSPEPPQEHRSSAWLWPLLVMLLLAVLCVLRLYLISPSYQAAKKRSANDALMIWYRACAQALACMGLDAAPGEAPASFLWRAHEALHGKPSLTGLGKAVCIASYSAHRLKKTQSEQARKTYEALLTRMTLTQKIKLYGIRLLKGV